MTVQPKSIQPAPETVTIGPITGSLKVYASTKAHPGIKVPFREVVLADTNEAPVRIYDPSGPYTEDNAKIDLKAGLPQVRAPWLAKRGFEAIVPRAVKPEDNGNLPAGKLVPECPAKRTILACVVHVTTQASGEWALGCNFIRELSEEDLKALVKG